MSWTAGRFPRSKCPITKPSLRVRTLRTKFLICRSGVALNHTEFAAERCKTARGKGDRFSYPVDPHRVTSAHRRHSHRGAHRAHAGGAGPSPGDYGPAEDRRRPGRIHTVRLGL